MQIRLWLVPLGVLTLGACASSPPTKELEASSAAIRAAEEVGATKEPNAALHLQLAKEETERARKRFADGDKEGAQRLLQRAEADANLAVALARTQQEQSDARGAMDRVNELKGSNK